ncbi:MAG: hypothetical protein BRC22_01305 [Parcubacteria group bacterium QH_9_35_7]|nr:MAG: hypothetical protein BRC22_01305 [Parcubacteria group bacterium QH_9_35_7]
MYTALFLNQKQNKFLQNKTMRSAISLAIDKDRVLQEALQSQGEVIHSPILPGFSGYSDDLQSEFNVKKANKKLNEEFKKVDKKEYRNLRKLSLLEEGGLAGTASTNTLKSFYRESDPAIQEEYTGDEGEYDQAVIIESGSNSTSQRKVTLNLQGSQNSKIVISNDTDFEDNKTRNFKSEIKWTLTPGNGKKWVFVKFQNSQGEQVVYDTIQLQNQFLSEKKYISKEVEPNQARIDKIKQQLDAELDNPQTFFRKDDEDNLVSFEIVTQNSDEYKRVAKLIKNFMAELGIRVDLKFVTPRSLSQRVIKNRTYDSLLYGVVVGGDGDQYPFWHSSQTEPPGLNLSQYENEDVDKLLDRIRTSTSSKKREQIYQKFQQKITEDQPAIFLYRPFYNYAQSKKIKRFDISGIHSPADRFSNITDWYLETKNRWDFSS